MDLLIFSGQSNMQGQTEADPKDKPINNALEYKLLSDSLVELKNPVGENIGDLLLGSHLSRGSLIPYFVDAYIKETNHKVIAVHVAKGATIVEQFLKSSEIGVDRYNKLVEKVNGAKRKAESIDKIYFIWLQGESDAISKTPYDKYVNQMIELKNSLKEDLNIDKFAIIEVGYFGYIQHGVYDYDEIIMKAQEDLPKIDKDFILLTDICKKLSLDNNSINPEAAGHYNNKTMKIIGEVAGSALAKMVK